MTIEPLEQEIPKAPQEDGNKYQAKIYTLKYLRGLIKAHKLNQHSLLKIKQAMKACDLSDQEIRDWIMGWNP